MSTIMQKRKALAVSKANPGFAESGDLPLLYGNVEQLHDLRQRLIDTFPGYELERPTGKLNQSVLEKIDKEISRQIAQIAKLEMQVLLNDDFLRVPKKLRTELIKTARGMIAKQYYK